MNRIDHRSQARPSLESLGRLTEFRFEIDEDQSSPTQSTSQSNSAGRFDAILATTQLTGRSYSFARSFASATFIPSSVTDTPDGWSAEMNRGNHPANGGSKFAASFLHFSRQDVLTAQQCELKFQLLILKQNLPDVQL